MPFLFFFTWHKNEEITKLCNSFGVVHLSYDEICLKNIFALIKSFLKTVLFIIFKGTGDKLKRLRIRDINVGLGIYED